MPAGRKKENKRARRILLCACGGYIVYSLPRIVLQLVHHFADDVQVVLSRAASKLVAPHAVEVASRNKVFIEMEDTGGGIYVPHIELGRNVDLVLVFPATVNILGKVANRWTLQPEGAATLVTLTSTMEMGHRYNLLASAAEMGLVTLPEAPAGLTTGDLR